MKSVRDITGIPPDRLEEVAVVPCGGCTARGLIRDATNRVVYTLRPHRTHWACIMAVGGGLPSVTQQLIEADAMINIAGCGYDCVEKIAGGVRHADRTINVEETLGVSLADVEKLGPKEREELTGRLASVIADAVDDSLAAKDSGMRAARR